MGVLQALLRLKSTHFGLNSPKHKTEDVGVIFSPVIYEFLSQIYHKLVTIIVIASRYIEGKTEGPSGIFGIHTPIPGLLPLTPKDQADARYGFRFEETASKGGARKDVDLVLIWRGRMVYLPSYVGDLNG